LWQGGIFMLCAWMLMGLSPTVAEQTPVLVKDIRPGGSSAPAELSAVGDTLYFSAADGVHGKELWKSDGTPEGTALVKDISPSGSSDIRSFVDFGGLAMFCVKESNRPYYGLWRSDETEDGTRGPCPISPSRLPTASALRPSFPLTSASAGTWYILPVATP
jgi:ELWxxDGT repeat protein